MKIRIIILFLVFVQGIKGQGIQPYPLEGSLQRQYEHEALRTGVMYHSFWQTGRLSQNDTSLYKQLPYFSSPKRHQSGSWLNRKLFHDNFFFVDSTDYMLTVDPLVDLQYGSSDGKSYYINTRGIRVEGRLGKNFFFHSLYYENQATFPTYLDSYIRKQGVVPGMGSVRTYNETGFDYAQAMGGFKWYPGKFVEISAGQGKHFLGDGYRSLLLSDNAYSYPYFKISANFWKVKYTTMFTAYQDMKAEHRYTSGYRKKYAAYHTLSVLLGKSVELSLFDAIIWQRQDSNYTRGFDVNYLNPIIFYHPVNFSMGSPDNAMLGANLSIRMAQQAVLYSQLVIDDMDVAGAKKGSGYQLTKYGYQVGLKWYDALAIDGLFLRAEYNQVRPYVYGHKFEEQSYTHYNQPLAHPQGANFKEFVGQWYYRYKRFEIGSHLVYCQYGDDALNEHYGHNIFLSDYDATRGFQSYGNVVGQGVATNLLYQNHSVSLCVNPRTNLNIVAGIEMRSWKQLEKNEKMNYVYFALRSSLTRWYKDF
jgi:hypothetical protein